LSLIDFLIKNGAERFVEECRDRIYKIRTLQDYNYYEGTIDKGAGVREKSRQIVELLQSNDLIKSEREKARTLRSKLKGIDSNSLSGGSMYDIGSRTRYDGDETPNYGRYGDETDRSQRSDRVENNQFKSRSLSENIEKDVETERRSPKKADGNGGKLKVHLKKSSVTTVSTKPVEIVPSVEVDLLGGDLLAVNDDPFVSTNSNGGDFDPFGVTSSSAPLSQAVPTKLGSQNSFFDPFSPAVPPAPVVDSTSLYINQTVQVSSMPPASYNQHYGSNMFPHNTSVPFNSTLPSLQQTTSIANSQSGYGDGKNTFDSNSSADADFGDFTSANEKAPVASSIQQPSNSNDKWSNLGSLVDLTKIEKNDEILNKQKAATVQSEKSAQAQADKSFAGLDGFSKTQFSMVHLFCYFTIYELMFIFVLIIVECSSAFE
jgi:hypothetical protein